MLTELQIENVAVIEKATVRFFPGLNVLTGETGAGKSILIDSINAILGSRTTREIVRGGTDKAVIFANFENVPAAVCSALAEQGYECDGTLILQREITAEGKSSCRIGGRPATAATVRELCQNLVTIHGQLDNQELLRAEEHINILDRYAELEQPVAAYRALYDRLTELRSEIEKLNMDEADKAARTELLQYQIDEIEKAQLEIGEEEQLTERRNLIKNSEKILAALGEVNALLSGGDGDEPVSGAVQQLYSADSTMQRLQGFSARCDESAKRLSAAYYELQEIASDIADQLDSFDFDESELVQTEERLDLIYRLKRKYGSSIEDILAYYDDAVNELAGIESADERLAQLSQEFGAVKKEAITAADHLSALRKTAFQRFEQQLKGELSYLNMPNIQFVVDRKRSRELTPLGLDIIEFFISTNIGEPPKPLAKIASGGELSRIMLALKCVLADKDAIGTLIFDEVDTGV
ncbi:MAG: DNA repair protein RecN, partial [Oscillospiraceae bacterium]|nr:DNA repair protein RecN [Oscillospiraceae bacterium]